MKELFEEVYHVPLCIEQMGTVEELYKQVQTAFNENPSDVMSWALK
jgi:hypothetical protein